MKILQVSNFFKPMWESGGVARSAYNISKSLVKRGHEVTIYTTYPTGRNVSYPNIETNRSLNIEGMKIYYFNNLREHSPIKIPPIPYYLPIVAYKEIKNFDIIHIHEHRTILAAVVHFYAKKYDVPYIFQARGSLPRIMGKQKLKKLYDLIYGYKITRDASKIIFTTKMELARCKEIFNMDVVDEKKIEIIPNGIDLSEYYNLPKEGEFRLRYSIGRKEKMILYLGRINEIKGLDLLVEVLADLMKEINDVRLVIIGIDDGYKNTLKEIIANLKIDDKVIFTGPLFGEDKLKAYVDADVFVLPSRYESFGNVALEACACGTPVIVTDNCGISEWINGDVGYVVRYDKVELRNAIFNVLSDNEWKRTLKEQGRKFIRKNFDSERIVSKIERSYLNSQSLRKPTDKSIINRKM